MTHEIVVNGRFLSRRVTGVERYGRSILSIIGDRCRLERTRRNGLRGHLWEQFVLPVRMGPNSVLWSPANTSPLMVTRQAITIHDLSVLDHPEWFEKSFALWYSLCLPMLVRRAQVIFTPSNHVKQKLVERFGTGKIVVTPNGVNQSVYHPAARQHRYELPPRYILFVGTLEPRKNIRALLQAWNQIRQEFKDIWLVVAGAVSSVHRKVDLPGRTKQVLFLGYVDEQSLPGLYANAILFVLPSFDEGFGLPALEAMACGTPVLVSNSGALPEIVADTGLMFEPSDTAALAGWMRQCLRDSELRFSLKENGLARAHEFSWQKSADLLWATLNEI